MKHPCQSAGVSLKLSGHKRHAAPSVLYFSSFSGGHSLAVPWQRPQIRKWLSIMDWLAVQFTCRGSSADYKELCLKQTSMLSPNRFLMTLCTSRIRASEACLRINLQCIVLLNVSHVWDHRHGLEVWGANLLRQPESSSLAEFSLVSVSSSSNWICFNYIKGLHYIPEPIRCLTVLPKARERLAS